MKHLFLVLIFVLVGCSKPTPITFDGTNHYQYARGSLLAVDYTGTNWFQQRQQEVPLGNMNGADYALPEQWLKLTGEDAGSHIITYSRTLATRNNTNLPPVFVRN